MSDFYCIQNTISEFNQLYICPDPTPINNFMKISPHYFWSDVNQKAAVIENILKMRSLKIQDFLYPEYDPDSSQNSTNSPMARPFSHKKYSEKITIML